MHSPRSQSRSKDRSSSPSRPNQPRRSHSVTAVNKQVYQKSRKIICVGRNFADHAKELGNAVPTSPVLFLKAPSCIIEEGQAIEIPPKCTELHHEVELGVIIGKGGRNIKVNEVKEHISGYFLGLDMTARELQSEAKAKGLPWSISKSYDTFAPVSAPIAADKISDLTNVGLWLKVQGEDKKRQDGTTSDMLWPVAELVAYISTIFTLEPNDLIFTGTPSGVGPVRLDDVIVAGLTDLATGEELIEMQFPVINRPEAV